MDNEIPNNKDVTYFARTNFRNTNTVFGIKRKDRRQHMYILGKSGTGKSVLLHNLITQNIKNGEGVCVIDPHGELAEEILELIPEDRTKDVIYFNPADPDYHIGFNVLQIDDPKLKHLVASGIMGIFTKIWANAWSSRMEYILNNAILALLDTPGTTLLGIPRLLVDKEYRQMIIGNLKDPIVKSFWLHEYEEWREQFRNEAIAPIQNKVGQFLSTSIIRNVVGQPKSTIDIFKIMNEGKIFIVNVSKGRIGEDNSALLGGMIITKIQLAAMERVRIPEDQRKDFYLYVDEFQNFATESFANILSEARKYRLNLIIAHQYIAQISNSEGSKVSDAVFGNVGTMIIFRVGAEDAQFLEKEFEPEFTAQDLVSLPNYNIYLKLMVDGVTSRPFSAITLPPMSSADPNNNIKDKIIESSRDLYARSRTEVESEIMKWSSTLQNGEGESKYKVDCTNCKKQTTVPFEPKEGKPVYCKECLSKIKGGELKPEKGFMVPKTNIQENKAAVSSLAALGIEFKSEKKEQKPSYNNRGVQVQNNPNQNNYQKDSNPVFDKKTNPNQNNNFDKKKSSGPSPLLRGLLEKIKAGQVKDIEDDKIEIQEQRPEMPKPISLSELKDDNHKKIEPIGPTKDVSDVNLANLKNAFSKITDKQILHRDDSVEAKTIEPEKDLNKDNKIKAEDDKDDADNSFDQTSKKIREVPEEVLRKVLE
jgi:CxxC-x17-CxxC domain-containing protein